MYDLWAKNMKTGECFRVTRDKTKPIYICEDGTTKFEFEDIATYKFYPCCPKDAPKYEIPEQNFEQTTIFDFIGGQDEGSN